MSSAAHSVARFGLVTKGVLYALLAVLATQIAFGNNADADTQGALRAVAARTHGTLVLSGLVVGFTGYAAWQCYLVWNADDWGERLPPLGRAVLWAGLSVSAVRFLLHAGTPRNSEQSMTARLLDLPPGQLAVGAIGVAIVIVGASFLRHLRGDRWFDPLQSLPPRTRRLVKVITVTGITGKAWVYILAGVFLVRAAVRHKAGSGVGLDGALSVVARRPYGTYVIAALAVGLAAYAIWCWVRARYENIDQSKG